MADKIIIDMKTGDVHIETKEGNGIRHEYWDKEQYERPLSAIGRHARYVCYEYPPKVKSRTASIIYKPHCSNCGSLIERDIKYQEHLTQNQDGFCFPTHYFIPGICPNCGEGFKDLKVILPEKEQSINYEI